MNGNINLSTDDIRVTLVMTNTTCDTETDVTLMNGFTTLGQCDSTGFARFTLTGETVSDDDGTDEARFDAIDATFSSVAADASFAIQGALVFKHVTNDAASTPICFVEFASSITANGGNIVVTWDSTGIFKGTSAT